MGIKKENLKSKAQAKGKDLSCSQQTSKILKECKIILPVSVPFS